MTRKLRKLLFLAAGGVGATVLAAATAWAVWPPPAPTPAAAPVFRPARRESLLDVGAAGCSARACHGGPESPTDPAPRGVGDNDYPSTYTFWLNHDKHAQAYFTLTQPRAADIAEKLARGAAHPDADKDPRCLTCHAPRAAAAGEAQATELTQEGVGCEACHGPAQGWLEAHSEKQWAANRRGNYGARGMTWLNDLFMRAAVCAGCHVGAPPDAKTGLPARDVNHDLIAAGHPRLNFEFTSYLEAMPSHWVEQDRTPAAPVAEARAWLIGQTAAAAASLRLLGYRAGRAAETGTRGPWPDFADRDCFACHHDLAEPSWRRETSGYFQGRIPGEPPWNSWYVSLPLRRALRRLAGGDDFLARVDALHRAVGGRPPDQCEAETKAAAKAADDLLPPDKDLIGELLAALGPADNGGDELFPADGLGRLGWDDAAQLYLELAALHQAVSPVNRRPPARRLLDGLAAQLAFPTEPVRYDSPATYRRPDASGAGLRRQCDDLLRLLRSEASGD